ncbi:hypothetical protein SCHPADRAFT_901697 [Schizopora paradoxa]|uniref:DUF6533 domain-containing protein n=1 Tax=Schizopora paradoxa TaxID=27342 RepID=A0A0H2RVT6_9AGAM|nr:hypothetical protein SCHPADRAFT_901697 [Schizopora paradoxa]
MDWPQYRNIVGSCLWSQLITLCRSLEKRYKFASDCRRAMSVEDLSTNVDQYYILASSAVFLYDFAITFPQEIEYLWSSKLKLVNVLVIALRYLTALGYVPVLVLTFAPIINARWQLSVGTTVTFLVIRLYAIYDKRRWILYVTFPFGMLSILLSSLAIGTATVGPFGEVGPDGQVDPPSCFALPNFNTDDSPMLYELSYISVILFDTLVFFLAALKTGRMYSQSQLYGSHSSIVSILLRDGTKQHVNDEQHNKFRHIYALYSRVGRKNQRGLGHIRCELRY